MPPVAGARCAAKSEADALGVRGAKTRVVRVARAAAASRLMLQ